MRTLHSGLEHCMHPTIHAPMHSGFDSSSGCWRILCDKIIDYFATHYIEQFLDELTYLIAIVHISQCGERVLFVDSS